MTPLIRTTDVANGKDDLELIYTFKNFPVFMGCTDYPRQTDIHCDMEITQSEGSRVIQLRKLVPLETLYPESHGSGTIGSLWHHHHTAFSQFVEEFNPKEVFEIGACHGILANIYKRKHKVDWTICEPNPHIIDGTDVKILKKFFDQDTEIPSNSTVVHSHVFEHLYDPREFLKTLSSKLEEGQKILISLPNMEEMIERKYTNCINFEHTILLTQDLVEQLHADYGFILIAKQLFKEDHSIFYAFEKFAPKVFSASTNRPYQANDLRKHFLDYISYYHSLVENLNQFLQDTDGQTFLFGAHVFSQYLFSFGLRMELIDFVLDNDRSKHGRRLYGTDRLVVPPGHLSDCSNPSVIVVAGTYTSEIVEQINSITNGNVRLLTR